MARIVVIGGGAAGIGASWGLARHGHVVTLIEREAALGGHCLAVPVPTADGGTAMVDVGVSDFNRATFTNVAALFEELGLGWHAVGQDASFMHADGRGAWSMLGGQIVAAEPFADAERFADEIARFRRECVAVLDDATMRDVTLDAYCDRNGYSDEFRHLYLYPRAQGSFPMPDCDPATYPVCGLVGFWRIHGLAGTLAGDRNVLDDGMASYGPAFARWLEAHGGEVITGGAVVGVARRDEGVRVRYVASDGGHETRRFDHVVFAVRGEQVLPLIEDASAEEQALFGALRWHRARVVVHSDARLMPADRAAWGAYNYVLNGDGVPAIRPTITFYPAKLAGIAGIDDIFVTMNPFREPDPACILHNQFFSHPAAGSGGDLAVARLAELQGVRMSWYCGSWMIQPWVHEQAMASGVELATRMHRRLDGDEEQGLGWLDDFLRSIPLFAGLDPFAIADVRLSADSFALAAAEALFEQGDAPDAIYIVADGEIALTGRTPGDGEVELARVARGGLIGEVALLDGGMRSAAATATTATRGYRIALDRFAALRTSGRPAAFEVIDRLRREVAQRSRATIADIGEALESGAACLPRSAGVGPLLDHAGQPIDADRARALLASFPGFDRLDAAEWGALADLCRRIDTPRGTAIAGIGDSASHLLIVARGAIRAALTRGDDIEQLLIHGPGRFAGLIPLFDGGTHPLALDVREDAVLLALPLADFAALRIGHGALATKLFDAIGQQLVGDLRRLSRQLGRIGGQD